MLLNTLAYFSLMMTFLSLWIHRTAWLWGAFLAISYILAFNTGIVQPFSLVPIGTLFILFWFLKKPVAGITRAGLVLLAIALAAGLNFHIMPGFCNFNVSGNFWLNFDVPFMGLFVLTFLIPLIRTTDELMKTAAKTIPLTILAVVIMAFLTVASQTVAWDPKLPPNFLLRLVVNLFLVVIPEEAFFRGFVQEELYKGVGQGFKGAFVAILATALLFALFHIKWTGSFAMLGFVFLAGIIYGSIYQYTRSIESSIFCHYTINVIHMNLSN